MPEPALPSAPGAWSRRGGVLAAIGLAGFLALLSLGLGWTDLVPHGGGLEIAVDFFSAAWQPALDYEDRDQLPEGALPFLAKVGLALGRTLLYAAAAMGLALVLGLVGGILASVSFWQSRRGSGPVRWAVRIWMALMRSVHELLWALLFLAAMGISPAAAVLAIAIPYGGTLAKIVSEMLDESPPQSADALRALGATRLQVFLFGRLPRALPDILAYAFYRFECAVRSSAVLGFFGYATVGLYLKQSFENLHYREVWTYLMSMLLLVLVLEAWSSRLRRSFVA